MTTSPTVIEYVLRRLRDIGVKDVFGVPGDFAFPVQDAIVAHPDINWIGCCNELNAGYAADGYARVNGVAALSTTYGVGELSAIAAVAGSYAEHLPVFHLTGMPTRATQDNRGLVHHTLGNGEFDLFRRMVDPVVSASAIITPANVVAETERLIGEALYHRRPVYMAFPSDVVDRPILTVSERVSPPVSDPLALRAASDAIASALEAATSACVLPGVLLDRLGIIDRAVKFIDTTGLPFATMFADKSVIDETHPNYIGMYDGRLMDERVRQFVESADVVICLGSIQTDFNTGAFTARLAPTRVIDVGMHRTTVGSTTFHNVEMAGLLNELVTRTLKHHPSNELKPGSLGPATGSRTDAITAETLYSRWAEFLRPADILFAETGTTSMGLAFAHLPHAVRFHNQTLWGSIGWATSAALGAAVAAPDRRVVLVTGEGAHQMTVQEIGQFHRLGLRPVIFVLNNSGYLIERLLCKDPDVAYNDVAPWNYAELPHALGCLGWFTKRVTTVGELDEALMIAGQGECASYVEVVTGPLEAPELSKTLHDNVKSLYSAN
jgi:indolepyruvate decarboxylase